MGRGSAGAFWRSLALAALLMAAFTAPSFGQQPTLQKPSAPTDKAQGAKEAGTPTTTGALGGIAAIITAFAALVTAIAGYRKARENTKQVVGIHEQVEGIDEELKKFERDLRIQLVNEDTIRIIKDIGHFLTSKDREGFGTALREVLSEKKTLDTIQLQGKLATGEDLQRIEQNVLELRFAVNKLEHTADFQTMLKKLIG